MNTLEELRKELSNSYKELKSGKLDRKVAREMNNAAKEIINSIKVQMEYRNMTEDCSAIEWLKK